MALLSYGPLTVIIGATLGLCVGLAWSWSVGRRLGRAGQAGDVGALIARGAERSVRVTLTNLSDRPVFGVVVWVVARHGSQLVSGHRPLGALAFQVLPMLPPGRREIAVDATGDDDLSDRAEIAFSDVGGEHWVRRADGTISSLATAPWRHYGFASPVGL